MRAKKKLIISMLVVSFVLLSIIATVAITFALTQQTIKTTLNIGYTVEDIDGSVYATYTLGGETSYLEPQADADHISEDGNSLLFKATDTENAGNLIFPNEALNLTKDNNNVVIKYTYKNTGGKHYIASMSFDADLKYKNMSVEYGIWDFENNKIKYSEDRYALVVPSGEELSYWIKISITNVAKNAEFEGDFSWLLNGCDKDTLGYESLSSLEFRGSNGEYSAAVAENSKGSYIGEIVFPSEVNGDPVTTIARSFTESSTPHSLGNQVTSVYIPDSVTTIASQAFYKFENLETVIFEQNEVAGATAQSNTGLTTIGSRAFSSCYNLREFIIPETVTDIGIWAFQGSRALEKVVFNGDGLTKIENYAFASTGLKSITIPAGVQTLVDSAFNGCTSLEVVKFDENSQLHTIERLAFYNCSSLKSFDVPKNVTTIGSSAFRGCENLKTINNYSNCPIIKGSIGESYIGYYATTINDANVQDGVKSIIQDSKIVIRAVVDDTVENVVIKSGTTTIPQGIFKNNKSIKSVVIPASVKTIEKEAFYMCSNLAEVNFIQENSQLSTIGDSAFYDTGLTYVVIPANVTSIGVYAFYSSLLHTFVNKSDLNIVVRSFDSEECRKGCAQADMIFTCEVTWTEETNTATGITYRTYRPKTGTNLTFDTVDQQGYSQASFKVAVAVDDNTKTTYTFDSDIDGIGYKLFESNKNLNHIVIPANVKSVGYQAFGNYYALAVVINLSELNITNIAGSTQNYGCLNYYIGEVYNKEVTVETFVNTTTNIKYLIVKDNGVQVDKIAAGIADASVTTSVVTLDADTTVVGYASFRSNTNITQVVLNDGLKRIAYNAFRDCSALTTINAIPATVTDIGAKAFQGTAISAFTFTNTTGWECSSDASSWTSVTSDISTYFKANLGKYYKNTNV